MTMYRHLFEEFDTAYIGGGTPSILDIGHIEKILAGIRENFEVSPDSEITLEANPADLDRDLLESLLSAGINRLNIGIQSFDRRVLSLLGRRHSSEEAVLAIQNARNTGFLNIGIDLIYGIPKQGMESWMQTIKKALSFTPEHLSCYQLTLAYGTPLEKMEKEGKISMPDEDALYDFFIKTSEVLEKNGYIHYEVSNFARKPRFMSRHNQKYWDHTDYLGLGPSAHSFFKKRRWWNHRSLDMYVNNIKKGNAPVEQTEDLTTKQLKLEAIYLGLRTKSGINIADFNKKYECDILEEKKKILEALKKEGLVEIQNGYLYPKRRGLALADSLALI
jgi:oxygen-independent coproporphyrinogen-3 oxidase